VRSHLLRLILLIALAAATSQDRADTPPTPPAPASPSESKLLEHGHYTNVDGKVVHSPAHTVSGQPPVGATAHCRDGSYSFSQHHRGTCSHHGGVASWL
jgi:hypothetical protein